jgi:amino acid transporter
MEAVIGVSHLDADEGIAVGVLIVAACANGFSVWFARLDYVHARRDRAARLPPEHLVSIAARTNVRTGLAGIILGVTLGAICIASVVAAFVTATSGAGLVGATALTIASLTLAWSTYGAWRDRLELEEMGRRPENE